MRVAERWVVAYIPLLRIAGRSEGASGLEGTKIGAAAEL